MMGCVSWGYWDYVRTVTSTLRLKLRTASQVIKGRLEDSKLSRVAREKTPRHYVFA